MDELVLSEPLTDEQALTDLFIPCAIREAISAKVTEQTLQLDNSGSLEQGFFVYDLDALTKHLKALNQQNVVKLWYAVKANPLSSIIYNVAKQGINFDVASQGELNHVLTQGIEPERILNTGPAKSKKQLAQFIRQGVNTFVIESIHQLNWLNECASDASVKPDVLLRVQLQWSEGEKNPLGGNSITPFGLGCQQWQTIQVKDYQALNICGLHIFQWGNMLSNETLFSLWQQMVEPLTTLAKHIGMSLRILDLGGGLGVDYENQGKGIHWQQAIVDLAEIKAMANVEELWLELGRYAVAECGYYVAPVVDVKSNFGQQQLVLSAGINHLLRPAITEQAFPACLLRESTQENIAYSVHGPLCTSLDCLGQLALPKDIAVDDYLVFSYCGAYGFTESMPFFLCHEIAGEYCYQQGQLHQIRAPEPASWYLR